MTAAELIAAFEATEFNEDERRSALRVMIAECDAEIADRMKRQRVPFSWYSEPFATDLPAYGEGNL